MRTITIGDATVSIRYRGFAPLDLGERPRARFSWVIDTPEWRCSAQDLWGPATGERPSETTMLSSLLSFLYACAEANQREPAGENADLFPAPVRVWVQTYSDEITMASFEIASGTLTPTEPVKRRGPRWRKVFGGAVTGYATTYAGLTVVAHRTLGITPAGWVWGVRSIDAYTRETGDRDEHGEPLRNPGTQYRSGYADTRTAAHEAAVAWVDSDIAEDSFRAATDPVDYLGHLCQFDSGEDYGTEPHWWTFVNDETWSTYFVTAPTLKQLRAKVDDFHTKHGTGTAAEEAS